MSNIELTFSMIKPDAIKRNIISDINNCFEKNGLKIVAQKMYHMTKEEAEKFYHEHKDRSFFNDMIQEITSSQVVLQVLEGKDAIKLNREIMGATNPAEAKDGTIRKLFGLDIQNNSVHGSDSPESAKREIGLFFSSHEIYSDYK